MTPAFRVTYEATDLTPALGSRLIELSVNDAAGIESDQVRLELDNRDGQLVVPQEGAWIDVALGYKETGLHAMGRFRVDDVVTTWPMRTLTMTGRAVDFVQQMKEAKTRAWTDVTLGQLISEVAGQNGLGAKIDGTLSAINVTPLPYGQLDQTDQSDFDLLTRLARDFDATFKVIEQDIIFIKRGGGAIGVKGRQPRQSINSGDIITVRARATKRGAYKAVRTHYTDSVTQERVEVRVGSGEPVQLLKQTFIDVETASIAAQGRLDALARGTASLTLELPGAPGFRAEQLIAVNVGDTLIDGTWSVQSVKHSYRSSGFKTSIEAEAPTP